MRAKKAHSIPNPQDIMNGFILILSVIVAVSAAQSQPASGVYFIAPPPSPPRVDLEKATEEVMAQLKKIDGANSGEYHVYLPDGRLQKVTYTTAPEQLSQYKHHRPSLPATQLSFQNNQQVNHQFVTGSNQQNSQTNQVKGRLVQGNDKEAAAQPARYTASISYTDVQPITGPVYTHSDQPLTRILRQTQN